MIVHFTVEMLISPFVIFGFPSSYWLTLSIDAVVVEISKNQSVVIQASSLADSEVFGISKGKHLHWACVIIGILVVDLENIMSFKIDDVDLGLGNVADYNLLVVDLSEEVDDVFVSPFEENFAWGIGMDDAFFGARLVHTDKHEGSFVSCWGAEDLWEFRFEFDGGLVP